MYKSFKSFGGGPWENTTMIDLETTPEYVLECLQMGQCPHPECVLDLGYTTGPLNGAVRVCPDGHSFLTRNLEYFKGYMLEKKWPYSMIL